MIFWSTSASCAFLKLFSIHSNTSRRRHELSFAQSGKHLPPKLLATTTATRTHHCYSHPPPLRLDKIAIRGFFLSSFCIVACHLIIACSFHSFCTSTQTVEAKRGRALIWPSVLDQDPESIDPRTDHQALPVMKGLKYGANAWLHQRDFKAVHAVGCA